MKDFSDIQGFQTGNSINCLSIKILLDRRKTLVSRL